MKTKKPSAIVYGWHRQGEELLQSDVYFEEHLYDEVQLYSLPYPEDVVADYTRYRPDLIISMVDEITIPHFQLERIHIHHNEILSDNILANIIVCQTVFTSCEVIRPRFSVFTPVYKTGERIRRTYQSLKEQIWTNWEWIVVDDSPDEETWKLLKEISNINNFPIFYYEDIFLEHNMETINNLLKYLGMKLNTKYYNEFILSSYRRVRIEKSNKKLL
jgi:hypothetical protein